MKKTFYLCASTTLLFATSCKKDYSCDCNISTTQQMYIGGVAYGSPTTASTTSSETFHDKEKNAKSSCDAKNGTVNQTINNTGYYVEQSSTTNCTLSVK